jgi:glucose/arabinose dehydrogenase
MPELPEPYLTPSVLNFSTVVGWPQGKTPKAPGGFEVTLYATGLDYPRWFHVLPNGDVLVAEARTQLQPRHDRNSPAVQGELRSRSLGESANRITLLRDADGDGIPEVRETFLERLNQPFGMALRGDTLYVANTDGVLAFVYCDGQTRIEEPGRKILDLPAGGYNNHWTRNIRLGPDGSKLYVTVGSASNVGEHGMMEEERRAAILEITPTAVASASSRAACATQSASTGSPRPARCGRR